MQECAPAGHPDLEFVHRVLDADETAAAQLRDRYQGKIVGVLCVRGASKTEAEDLTADLWADCFSPRHGGQPLLSKYNGRCALESWLITVAMHRLVDLKRRQTFRVSVPPGEDSSETFFERQPQPETRRSEEPLLVLLHDAINHAFAKRESDAVLMMKLVHVYQITQREIARMWGWHESKVSRAIEDARKGIESDILAEVKRKDPWLELQWDDFIGLCERSPELFAAA